MNDNYLNFKKEIEKLIKELRGIFEKRYFFKIRKS